MKLNDSLRAINLGLGLRVFASITAVVALAAAVFLWSQQVRYEGAYQYACDIPAYQVVGEDCLQIVQVPVNRQFDTVTEEDRVVGLWTKRPVASGELVHSTQISVDAPDRFRFQSSGNPLPENAWGYYMPLAGEVLAAVKPGHLLTLAVVDPLTQEGIIIVDKVKVLDTGGSGVYVGAAMEQIAALEGLKAELVRDADAQPWLVWTITQGANPDLPSLAVFSTRLTAASLAPQMSDVDRD